MAATSRQGYSTVIILSLLVVVLMPLSVSSQYEEIEYNTYDNNYDYDEDDPLHCDEMNIDEKSYVRSCMSQAVSAFLQDSQSLCRTSPHHPTVNITECPGNLYYQSCSVEMEVVQTAATFICNPGRQGCYLWPTVECLEPLFQIAGTPLPPPPGRDHRDIQGILNHTMQARSAVHALNSTAYCAANLTFDSMYSCVNTKLRTLMNTCNATVILGQYNLPNLDLFAPWTDTIYYDIQSFDAVLNSVEHRCNSGDWSRSSSVILLVLLIVAIGFNKCSM